MVRIKDGNIPIGIISFIKREYLPHHDLGFAFLPGFIGRGYAFEAASAVKMKIMADKSHTNLLATTIPQNSSSISLLKKLGFQFEKQIEIENEILHVYLASTSVLPK